MRFTAVLPDLRPTEDVVLHAHRHWSAPLRQALPIALALAATVTLTLASDRTRAAWPAPWALLAGYVLLALVLLTVARLVWIYLDWCDDALIVTTYRVVHVDKLAFLHESRRELPLGHVHNVAVHSRGLLAAWLGFGDILIEAAGTSPVLMAAVPAPHRIRQLIFELQTQQQARLASVQVEHEQAAVRAALELTAADGNAAAHELAPAQQTMESLPPLVWRRHWWFLVRSALRPCLLLVGAGTGLALAPSLPGLRGELALLLAVALLSLALIGAGSLIWALLAWREDHYMLDGDRLLDIRRAPFRLSQEVRQTSLAHVQDISYRIPNPLAHLLDYGDVAVETAGETQRFTFDGVANPRAVHAEIGHRLILLREAEAAGRSTAVQHEVLALLRAYHGLTTPPDSPPPAAST